MQIGAHVSSSGGIDKAIDRAVAIGADSRAGLHAEPAHVAADEPRPGELRALPGERTRGRDRRRRLPRRSTSATSPRPTPSCTSGRSPRCATTMEVARRDRGRRVVFHVGSHLGSRLRGRARARRAGAGAGPRALHRRDVARDGELRRRRRHDRPLDRGARDDLVERLGRPSAARGLPRLVPPLRVRRRRDRSGRARRLPRRARRDDRPRPAARAARQRQPRRRSARTATGTRTSSKASSARSSACSSPTRACKDFRPCSRRRARGNHGPDANEIRKTKELRARWLSLKVRAMSGSRYRTWLQRTVGLAPKGVSGSAVRERGRSGGDTAGSWYRPCTFGTWPVGGYRWVVLGGGDARAGELLRLLGRAAGARPRAQESEYGLTLGETGVVLAGIGIGMLFTLLPWGLVADRVDERWVIATGLTGAAALLLVASTTNTFGAVTGVLVGRRSARGERQRRQRPRDHGVVPRVGARPRARHPPDGDPDRRRARRARPPRPRVGGRHPRGASSSSPARARRERSSRPYSSRRRGSRAGARATSPPRCTTRACGCSALGTGLYLVAQIGITGFVVLFLHERPRPVEAKPPERYWR